MCALQFRFLLPPHWGWGFTCNKLWSWQSSPTGWVFFSWTDVDNLLCVVISYCSIIFAPWLHNFNCCWLAGWKHVHFCLLVHPSWSHILWGHFQLQLGPKPRPCFPSDLMTWTLYVWLWIAAWCFMWPAHLQSWVGACSNVAWFAHLVQWLIWVFLSFNCHLVHQ